MTSRGERHGSWVHLLAAVVLWCASVPAFACTEHRNDVNDLTTFIRVPGVIGDPEAVAVLCLQRYGYAPRRAGDVASKLPKGAIVRTEPAEGTAPIDSRNEGFQRIPVTYWVSSGERAVPDVVGDSVTVARIKLALNSFRLGDVTKRPQDGSPGRILEQDPGAGDTAAPDTPVNVVVSAEYPLVPDVIGQDEAQAVATIAGGGFEASNQGSVMSEKRAGLVVKSDPLPNTRVRPGSTIDYWLTSGQNTVPDLHGLTREQAAQRVASAGFMLGPAEERVDLGTPAIVVDQQPAANARGDIGSGVTVWISRSLLVPDVIGKTEAAANAELHALNLSGVLDGKEASSKPGGEVLVTEPAAGTKVMEHTVVHYRTTSGTNAVPDVIGMTAAQAASALDAAAFELGQLTSQPTSGPQGIIVEQHPVGGELLAVRQSVDITVSSDLPIVPNVIGEARDVAEDLIRKALFKPHAAGDEPSRQSRGIVLRTDPPVGTKQEIGASIDYWIASGKNVVPNLVHQSRDEAQRRATLEGFRLSAPTFRYAPAFSEQIVAQTPAAAGLLDLNSSITIAVGSDTPPVPDVVGMPPDDARSALAAVGMTVAPHMRKRYAVAGDGRVTEQQPHAGTVVPSGQPVQVALTTASPLLPIIAGSTVLMALLAGVWWTQARPWPLHWPPAVGIRASLEGPGAPWPELAPPVHDPARDVNVRVTLIGGETTFLTPLPIIHTELRHD